ncbi:DegV family protein [Salirhabdus salicampi]|uniref:DegV family protein n=1 Tax=Salirhabdus salicampi TaxID=476102 RepID=UPI0020C47E84|nr:DegV family protein [Salirhabdus salicampi]MCP8615550.1 DegV family protein [Salirhabdus salicampi]
MSIKIITDSGADLPKSYYSEYEIDMVPLNVHLNEKDYEDGVTIESKSVYDAMREGAVPKTSQPSPEAFMKTFSTYVERGLPCLYIGFSSQLSGTFQSATIARQQILESHPNAQIHLVDSKSASMGLGFIVLKAAELAKQGASMDEIVKAAEFYANHMEHIVTVDNLEYLLRGGRLSRTSAIVGGLLNIKPILIIEEGKLIPHEKIRGTKKVYKRMVEITGERAKEISKQTVIIGHADAPDSVKKLESLIQDTLNPQEIAIHDVGSAIGAHAGPGALAIFFLNDLYE